MHDGLDGACFVEEGAGAHNRDDVVVMHWHIIAILRDVAVYVCVCVVAVMRLQASSTACAIPGCQAAQLLIASTAYKYVQYQQIHTIPHTSYTPHHTHRRI